MSEDLACGKKDKDIALGKFLYWADLGPFELKIPYIDHKNECAKCEQEYKAKINGLWDLGTELARAYTDD